MCPICCRRAEARASRSRATAHRNARCVPLAIRPGTRIPAVCDGPGNAPTEGIFTLVRLIFAAGLALLLGGGLALAAALSFLAFAVLPARVGRIAGGGYLVSYSGYVLWLGLG